MRKPVKITFYLFLLALCLWFVSKGGISLYKFNRLSMSKEANLQEITIKRVKGDTFALFANFTFNYKGDPIKGSSFVGPSYPNHWAAEKGLETVRKKGAQTVWFHPKAPEKAVLSKKFPLKEVFSACVVLSICAYFFILEFFYMRKI